MADRTPTRRQAQVLRIIWRSIEDHGRPPTVREIGAAMEIRSTNGVTDHLRALERKGLIERTDAVSRGIAMTDAGLVALGTEALRRAARHHHTRAAELDELLDRMETHAT